jgi:hypothetical protein
MRDIPFAGLCIASSRKISEETLIQTELLETQQVTSLPSLHRRCLCYGFPCRKGAWASFVGTVIWPRHNYRPSSRSHPRKKNGTFGTARNCCTGAHRCTACPSGSLQMWWRNGGIQRLQLCVRGALLILHHLRVVTHQGSIKVMFVYSRSNCTECLCCL